jgi:hypothetical protein
VPAHLIHLFCGHADPTRHSLIYVRNDIRVETLADAVPANQSPKYRTIFDAGAIQPFP